jgi:hypothetical protein
MPFTVLDAIQRLALLVCYWTMNTQVEQLGVSGNCVERSAQFMTHRSEKVAFALVGGLCICPGCARFFVRAAFQLVESRIYQRYGAAAAELECKRQVLRCITTSAFHREQHEHTGRLAINVQWDGDGRLVNQQRFARANHAMNGVINVEIKDPLFVVRHGKLRERAAFIETIDDRRVGKTRQRCEGDSRSRAAHVQ